jgi:hypothetical protein
MPKSGEYKALPDDPNRYAIEVYRTSNFCKEGEVHARYRGSSNLFNMYRDSSIRRQANSEIISVDYSKYPAIRGLGLFALIIALLSPAAADDPKVGILCGIGGALLLGLALALTKRSKDHAIHSLKEQVRREIDLREGGIRDTGRLHEEGAQQVKATSPQPSITIVNNNTVFSPPNSQSPLNSSTPTNYQATKAQVPPQEAHSPEGYPPPVSYGYQTSPS